jgi:AraC family L-rhamnose operon regulatory protein RhaS
MRAEIALSAGHGLVLVERPAEALAWSHHVHFQSLRVRRADGRHRVAAHRHADYEILLPLQGIYHCSIDGTAWTARPGEVLMVRPGEVHADDSPGPLRLAAVACSVAPAIAWGAAPRVVPFAGGEALIAAWSAEPEHALAGEVHDARCRTLLLHLLRHAAPTATSEDSRSAFRRDLLRRLDSRLAQPIDLDRLARDLHVSRRGLSERCRDVCGTSPARLLQEVRLQRARVLLLETELPIKDVARRCGFANPNHFSTAFHRRFGLPPRQQDRLPAEEGRPPAQ